MRGVASAALRAAVFALITAAGATGCISRSLTIRSNPPGAKLYVQDELLGVTPHTFDPVWYGGYRLRLEKDGYERLNDRRMYKAPKKFWIPLDLVMTLVPWEVRDDRVWEYTLTKAQPLPEPVPPPLEEPEPEGGEAAENEGGEGS